MVKERKKATSSGPTEWQRLGAEFIGTFLLTFTAAGADAVEYASNGTIGHVARYAAPGLLVMAMIWSLSGISGAHINPAVTVGFLAHRSFPIIRIPGYLIAQCIGAIAAAGLLYVIVGADLSHGVNKPTAPFTDWSGFITEIVLTFILVFTILSTAEQEAVVGKNVALAVGGIIILCGFAFSPLSGASMNPARSLGPAIVAGEFTHLWIYLTAPFVGALIAAGAVRLLLGDTSVKAREAAAGKGE